VRWLAASTACEKVDKTDPLAAQWLIRVFLVLWCWPLKDPATERANVERFLGPSCAKI
jgi:hypothetical protein